MVAPNNEQRPIIVAIDGPAGSGKSTVCARVSQKLNWTYVNTGFLYRAAAVIAQRQQYNLDSPEDMLRAVETLNQQLDWRPEEQTVWLGQENLTSQLYQDTVGQAASKIAKIPEVRTTLLPLQRRLALASRKPAIVDGRDIGTVVFPDADLKIFLTASIEERARRRLQQLERNPANVSAQAWEDMKASIARRDSQDTGRGTAPLKQADDAVKLDTSQMTLDEVINQIIQLIETNKLL
jgi:cytidylate kinase